MRHYSRVRQEDAAAPLNEHETDLRHRVRLALAELDELLKILDENKVKLKSAEVDMLLMQARRAKVAVRGIQTTA